MLFIELRRNAPLFVIDKRLSAALSQNMLTSEEDLNYKLH